VHPLLLKVARYTVPPFLRPLALRIYTFLVTRERPKRTTLGGKSDRVIDCCIAYNDLGGYCIPLSSLRNLVSQTILKGEIWERSTIEFIMTHCGQGDVIHAGAYFGDFIPGISNALSAGAKLWAFEPDPGNYRCASITKLLNGLQNVELKPAGLGKTQQTVEFVVESDGERLGPEAWIVEKGRVSNQPQGATINIELVPIDEVVPADRSVSIIHLDIEGYEPPAIEGALETIRRCRPILIIEAYHLSDNWLIKQLAPLGYHKTKTFGFNVVMEPAPSARDWSA
jgi:FkbM family methyltransferase